MSSARVSTLVARAWTASGSLVALYGQSPTKPPLGTNNVGHRHQLETGVAPSFTAWEQIARNRVILITIGGQNLIMRRLSLKLLLFESPECRAARSTINGLIPVANCPRS